MGEKENLRAVRKKGEERVLKERLLREGIIEADLNVRKMRQHLQFSFLHAAPFCHCFSQNKFAASSGMAQHKYIINQKNSI